MPPKLSRLMRLTELAKMLKLDGTPNATRRRLLRQLRRLEERTGNKIIIKGGGKRPMYYVTLATLRETHPDFFYRRDEAQEALREYVDDLDERMAKIVDRIDTVAEISGDKIKQLKADIESVKQRVRELEEAQ